MAYAGPGRISVARWVPKGTIAGYRIARWLAPPAEWRHLPKSTFEQLYLDQLRAIGAQQIWGRLHGMVDAEPTVLCWERLHRPGEWCHRRMLAAFLEFELGVEVPELGRQETLDFA